jgi:hypothetical protein
MRTVAERRHVEAPRFNVGFVVAIQIQSRERRQLLTPAVASATRDHVRMFTPDWKSGASVCRRSTTVFGGGINRPDIQSHDFREPCL